MNDRDFYNFWIDTRLGRFFNPVIIAAHHFVFMILGWTYWRYRVYGERNVPKKGPVILAANHASYLDPAVVGTGLWRTVNYAARENLFRNRWGGMWIRMVLGFPISRDDLDRRTLRAIMRRLQDGRVILLFPEGTRTPDGGVRDFKPGIGMLAYLSRAPVVPAYIKGSFEAFPRGARFPKPHPISICFGGPVDLSRYFSLPKYKGIYADMAADIRAAVLKLKEESNKRKR